MTDYNHNFRISPNVLNRKFAVDAPRKVWVSDLTYIRLRHSFVYLTTVIDLADRMVIRWRLSSDMTDQNTTIAAFENAIKNRPIAQD